MKRKAVICDIDGVILTCTYYADMEEFYQNILECYPIDPMVSVIKGFHQDGYEIIFLTARNVKCRGVTTYQLQKCFDFPIKLYMRGRDDIREDWIMKQECVQMLSNEYEFVLALDDNPRNCQMFIDNKIPTIQVTK